MQHFKYNSYDRALIKQGESSTKNINGFVVILLLLFFLMIVFKKLSVFILEVSKPA